MDFEKAAIKDLQQKINEKLQLFINSKIIIYCADDEALQGSINTFKQTCSNNIRLFGWSQKDPADLYINKIEKRYYACPISLYVKEHQDTQNKRGQDRPAAHKYNH